MLSKVLKGSDARNVQAMDFATAAVPARQPRQAAPSSGPAGSLAGAAAPGADQAALMEKIRLLEAAAEAAKRDAFEAGRQQGEQQAKAAIAPVLERMNASIAEVIGMRPELRRRAEKDAVELSLQIARRVLHRELSIDSNALNALARVVFDRLGRSESWQLTIHPQFAEAIRGALPAGSGDKVRIETDPSCAPGTLIVRSAEGAIDASVDSQLVEISHGLTDRLTRK
jgi:flagellar assembly protein FliH